MYTTVITEQSKQVWPDYIWIVIRLHPSPVTVLLVYCFLIFCGFHYLLWLTWSIYLEVADSISRLCFKSPSVVSRDKEMNSNSFWVASRNCMATRLLRGPGRPTKNISCFKESFCSIHLKWWRVSWSKISLTVEEKKTQ